MINSFGGAGSGFFGHKGRKGQVGGSSPSGSKPLSVSQNKIPGKSDKDQIPIDERDYFPGEEQAQEISGASIEDIHIALSKAYAKDPLTIREMRILQAGWPNLYGKPGSKFHLSSQEELEDALAFDETTCIDSVNLQIARYAEVHRLPFNVASKAIGGLTDFGGPGSGHFGHSGRSGQLGGSVPGSGGPAGTTERSSASSKGLSEVLSKARRIDSPQTLTDADKKILQQNYPDIYGKPGSGFTYNIKLKGEPSSTASVSDMTNFKTSAKVLDDKASEKLMSDLKITIEEGKSPTVEDAIADQWKIDTAYKISQKEPLDKFDMIISESLQREHPEIYGKATTDFTDSISKLSTEDKRKVIASTLELSSEDEDDEVDERIENAFSNADGSFMEDKNVDALQVGWPEIFGRPGTPFIPSSDPDIKDKLLGSAKKHSDITPDAISPDLINLKIAHFSEVHRLSLEDGAKSVGIKDAG